MPFTKKSDRIPVNAPFPDDEAGKQAGSAAANRAPHQPPAAFVGAGAHHPKPKGKHKGGLRQFALKRD